MLFIIAKGRRVVVIAIFLYKNSTTDYSGHRIYIDGDTRRAKTSEKISSTDRGWINKAKKHGEIPGRAPTTYATTLLAPKLNSISHPKIGVKRNPSR